MANWTILNTIDEGGFGKIYEVIDKVNNQKGALKELKSIHSVNVKRFEREIGILQNLNHTNVIKILGWNLNGNPPSLGPFYVMEYMAGGSLRAKMISIFNSGRLFSQKWTLDTVILPVIEALQHAHLKGTFHRDLKPANLLFTTPQHNHLKVADWGLGKDVNRTLIALTVGGLGTPGYCAPEQWFALDNVDVRADIYSLGVLFYEMMTGKLPPQYNNNGQRAAVLPPSQFQPKISRMLDAVILKMIELRPENRYQTITQLKTALIPINNLLLTQG